MATISLLERQTQWNKGYQETLVNDRKKASASERNFEFDYPARKLISDIVPPKSKLLDIGSGPFPHTYLPQGLASFSIDISQTALIGKKNAAIADAENLPFQNHSFPFIVCKEVYSYVPNPENLLSEILRVLASQGTLVIINAEGNLAKHDPTKMWLNDFNSEDLILKLSPYFKDLKTTTLKEMPRFRMPDNTLESISLKALIAHNYQA